MFKRTGITSDNKAGQGWEQFHGENMYISVGYGPVMWAVDMGNDVWFKQLGAIKIEDSTEDWILVDDTGVWVQLDVGRDGHVMAVNSMNELHWRDGITPDNKEGTGWSQMDDNQQTTLNVAICSTGQYWKVGTDNALYFRTEVYYDDDLVGDSWDRVLEPQFFSMVSCGGNGALIAVEQSTMKVFEAVGVSNQYPRGTSW
jgi:hypothetical protein